jgi:hypothetical protein
LRPGGEISEVEKHEEPCNCQNGKGHSVKPMHTDGSASEPFDGSFLRQLANGFSAGHHKACDNSGKSYGAENKT